MKSNFDKYLDRAIYAVGMIVYASSMFRTAAQASEGYLSAIWGALNILSGLYLLYLSYRVLRKGVE